MDQGELLWRQYNLNAELYKHYLKLTIEFNVFYYAITGAIVSYYLTHAQQPMMRFALLLPMAMSVLFACFFAWGGWLARVTRRDTFELRDALGLRAAPEMGILVALLSIFAVLMLFVAAGLGYLYATTASA